MKIFISYRREDTGGYAGRIYDRLCNEFGKESVFFDVVAIPFGYDFKDYLDERLAACDYVLALIGKRWMEIANEHGTTRISETDDILRLELAAALRRDIPVTPILIDGASLPKDWEVPSELAGLSRRQALVLTQVGFHDEMSRLVQQIRAELDVQLYPGFRAASEGSSSSQSNALSLELPRPTPPNSSRLPMWPHQRSMLASFLLLAGGLAVSLPLTKSIGRLFDRAASNSIASASAGDARRPAEPTSSNGTASANVSDARSPAGPTSGGATPLGSYSHNVEFTPSRIETWSVDEPRPSTAAPIGLQPTKSQPATSPRKRSAGQAHVAMGRAVSASHEAPRQPSAPVGQGCSNVIRDPRTSSEDCPGDPGCFIFGQKNEPTSIPSM